MKGLKFILKFCKQLYYPKSNRLNHNMLLNLVLWKSIWDQLVT